MGSKLSDYLFYQDDWATIYCGDCLEVMPLITGTIIHSCVTDPPFAFTGGISNGRVSEASNQFYIYWGPEYADSLTHGGIRR